MILLIGSSLSRSFWASCSLLILWKSLWPVQHMSPKLSPSIMIFFLPSLHKRDWAKETFFHHICLSFLLSIFLGFSINFGEIRTLEVIQNVKDITLSTFLLQMTSYFFVEETWSMSPFLWKHSIALVTLHFFISFLIKVKSTLEVSRIILSSKSLISFPTLKV